MDQSGPTGKVSKNRSTFLGWTVPFDHSEPFSIPVPRYSVCSRIYRFYSYIRVQLQHVSSCFSSLAPVVQRLDNAIQRINRYPVDNVVCFVNIYPLDSVIQPLNNRGLVSSLKRRFISRENSEYSFHHS